MCDVKLWYDKAGNCNGLHVSNSCSSATVTHLNVTPMADSRFDGFFVSVLGYNDPLPIVDANGDVVYNVADVLRAANLSGNDRTLTQTTTCNGNLTHNRNNVCVDMSGNTEYVKSDGGEPEEPTNVVAAPGCWWVYNFDIEFYDRPPTNPPHTVGTFASGLAPGDNDMTRVSHKYGDGFYNAYNQKITKIKIPLDSNYAFRGYYGATFNYINYLDNTQFYQPIPITDVITDHTTEKGTVWGGRFAVPVGETEMVLGTPNLKTSYCDMDWINCDSDTPGQCGDPSLIDPVTVKVYGGWARKCDASHGDCGLEIFDHYDSNNIYIAAHSPGDVRYQHSCNPGYELASNDQSNSYLVQCTPINVSSIDYEFVYMYYDGSSLQKINSDCSGSGTPSNGTCSVGTNISLPSLSNLTCGTKSYKFSHWVNSSSQEYTNSIPCTAAALGVTSSTSTGKASIIGILCDCNLTYNNNISLGMKCAGVCNPADTLNLGVGFTVDENVTAAGGSGTSN
jgi:hypothetical protein